MAFEKLREKWHTLKYDNRYFYRMRHEAVAAGGSKRFNQFRGVLGFLIHHGRNCWDYLEEIRANQYVYELGKHPGVYFYVPLCETDYIQKHLVREEDYFEAEELAVLASKYIPREAVILDIGANIGNHTIYFAKECGAKRVYAFEPMPETFSFLEKNISLNHLEGVTKLYHTAVGNGRQTHLSVLQKNPVNLGATCLTADESGTIPSISIDSLDLQEPVGFVKIDVEGFEVSVLEGAVNTLKKYRPNVFVETFDGNYGRVVQLMAECGYRQVESFPGSNYLFSAV